MASYCCKSAARSCSSLGPLASSTDASDSASWRWISRLRLTGCGQCSVNSLGKLLSFGSEAIGLGQVSDVVESNFLELLHRLQMLLQGLGLIGRELLEIRKDLRLLFDVLVRFRVAPADLVEECLVSLLFCLLDKFLLDCSQFLPPLIQLAGCASHSFNHVVGQRAV